MVAPEGFRLQRYATAQDSHRGNAPALRLIPDACRLLLLSLVHERAETTVSRNLGVALRKRAFACRADLGRLPARGRVRALYARAWRGRSLSMRHRQARSPYHPDGGARGEGPT